MSVVLAWRPWLRSELTGSAPAEAQALEDARLGVESARIFTYADWTRFRRRPDSFVWHWRWDCPHWPEDVPWVESVAWPGMGRECVSCARLDGK